MSPFREYQVLDLKKARSKWNVLLIFSKILLSKALVPRFYVNCGPPGTGIAGLVLVGVKPRGPFLPGEMFAAISAFIDVAWAAGPTYPSASWSRRMRVAPYRVAVGGMIAGPCGLNSTYIARDKTLSGCLRALNAINAVCGDCGAHHRRPLWRAKRYCRHECAAGNKAQSAGQIPGIPDPHTNGWRRKSG